jgi:hypothetical protein
MKRPPALTRLLLCLVAPLSALSCQKDEIESYEVPRIAQAKHRLLAAIVPHGERTWFFKLVGPEAEIARCNDEFTRFLGTIRFTDQSERPVVWTLPDGWQEMKGDQLRYATIRVGPENAAVELTVIGLGREAGSLEANVNRWRGQIGLAPASEQELAKVTRKAKVGGTEATLVDMTGTGSAGGKKRPPFVAARMGGPEIPRPSASKAPIRYAKPEGWNEVPDRTGFRAASFEVNEGDKKVEITVIPLGPSAGSLADNVKRWRDQVGLGPVSPEQVEKDVRRVTIDGEPASMVDVLGPESAGSQREELVAAMLPHREKTWFFKMKGPSDLVGKQKSAFEAFLKSIHFSEAQE